MKYDRDFFGLVLDLVPDPVFVKDEQHRWIYGNQAFSKLLELDPKDYLGKTDYDFFSKANSDHYWRVDDEVFLTQKPIEIEEKFKISNSTERTLLTHKMPCYDLQNRKILIGVIKDITEKKRLQSAFHEVTRLASLGEMAAGIAHEINNPLEIIRGTSSLLRRRLQKGIVLTSQDLLQSFSTIEDTIDRIALIIKGLNFFSKRQSMEFKTRIKIADIINDTLSVSRERFKNLGIHCTTKFLDDPELECIPVQISQVLLNLLNNSCDAIRNMEQRWIRLETRAQDAYLCISITDSGTGIPQSISDRMMEPFFTTKAVSEGTGLGLSISKGIIESHSGKIVLNSQYENTQFLIYLPLYRPPQGN